MSRSQHGTAGDLREMITTVIPELVLSNSTTVGDDGASAGLIRGLCQYRSPARMQRDRKGLFGRNLRIPERESEFPHELLVSPTPGELTQAIDLLQKSRL